MNKSNTSLPESKQNITINIPKLPTSALRDPNLIEVGGGIIPGFKCTRENLSHTVVAIGAVVVCFFTAKHGIPRLFHEKVSPSSDNNSTAPRNPPKVENLLNCVNNAGTPKKTLITNMITEGGLSVIGGREGSGKTLLGHQCAIELARGYGNLVANGISPQTVLIIDGELDDDDYVDRFGHMDIPSTITRVSDCDFDNLKQLAGYLKDIVTGLHSPTTIFIDNLVALSLENLTGKSVNEFFRALKKIQSESQQTITLVIVDHIGKAPEEDGRGHLWTEEDTERLAELASTLETPDKETIGLMMDRHPNLIYRKAKMLGIQLMTKPRGRKPKKNSEQ